MALDTRAMQAALTSLAASTGVFDAVVGHEPKAAPSVTGVTCAVFFMEARPVQSSGLNSVSMRVEYFMRVYSSMLQEPQDLIDPRVMDAADALLAAIVGRFQLTLSDVRYVDLLGADGDGLRTTAGYLTQDGKPFRTIDVIVPIVINDVYLEAS